MKTTNIEIMLQLFCSATWLQFKINMLWELSFECFQINHGLQAFLVFLSSYISLGEHQHSNFTYDNCCILTSVFIYHLVNVVKKYSLFILRCRSSGQHSSLNKSKLLYKRPWFMMKIFLLTWSQLCFRWLIHTQHFLVIVNSKCFQFYSLQIYAPIFLFLVALYAFQIYYASSIRDVLCLRTACSILLLVKIMLVWEW